MAEGPPRDTPFCRKCYAPMHRVYSLALGNRRQLKVERERGGASAVRDMFLPTAKDMAGPGDPDGTKGIQEWADEHQPKMGNKRPMYPDIPRRSW